VPDIDIKYALGFLLNHKRRLSRQQYKTLKGQILAGDPDGALRGLQRILIVAGSNAIKKP
jgi:hypothetical protein